MFNGGESNGCRRPNSRPERPSALGEEESGMKMCRLVTSIGLFALLASCAVQDQGTQTPGRSGIKGFKVKLEVTDDGRGNAVLDNKNPKTPGCDKFPDEDRYRKGCIVAGVNEMVEVEFKLSGTPGWYFAAFQVCSMEAENPAKPETFDNCELTDEQRADFLVLANAGIAIPDEHGRVDISAFGTGLRQFEVRDLNWMAGNYFYGVQACSDAGETRQCLWTDPGWENKGNNRN
jgi:hypothetical protein